MKIKIPDGYMLGKVKKVNCVAPLEKVLVWHSLNALEENKLLPKGYMTRVINQKICYESAKNYTIKTLNNIGRPFDIHGIENDDKYYIITFLKVI